MDSQNREAVMNNQVAIGIVALLLGLLVLDHFWLEQNLLLHTGKLLDRAIDYFSFWR